MCFALLLLAFGPTGQCFLRFLEFIFHLFAIHSHVYHTKTAMGSHCEAQGMKVGRTAEIVVIASENYIAI